MFSEKFKSKRKETGLSQREIAPKLHVSQQTVASWENGTRMPSPDVMLTIAEFFNVSTDYLLGRENATSPDDPLTGLDNVFPITRKKFPLIGDIACGQPIYADEDRESYIIAGTDIQADFCLRAKGDSMIGARILDGDIVFIKAMPIVENGSIAAVIIGDEATLKRVYYYPDKQKLVLSAENPRFEPMVYLGEELNAIRILGKAIAFQSDVL
jgi:repressor LexA